MSNDANMSAGPVSVEPVSVEPVFLCEVVGEKRSSEEL